MKWESKKRQKGVVGEGWKQRHLSVCDWYSEPFLDMPYNAQIAQDQVAAIEIQG